MAGIGYSDRRRMMRTFLFTVEFARVGGLAGLAREHADHRLVSRLLRETPARNCKRHDGESREYGDIQADAEVRRHGRRQDGVLEKIDTISVRIDNRGAFQAYRQTLDRVERSAQKKDREDDEVHGGCEVVQSAGKRCRQHTYTGASE